MLVPSTAAVIHSCLSFLVTYINRTPLSVDHDTLMQAQASDIHTVAPHEPNGGRYSVYRVKPLLTFLFIV